MGLFTMPRLGADMERGTLLEWRVAPGDAVRKGDIVALIDTEKSTVDIEVFESGTVAELLVEPGTEVEVGTPLARISADGHAPAPAPAEPAAPPTATAAPPPTATAAPPSPAVPPSTSVSPLTSPLVRHRAEELHIDTSHLAGTGPGHRITRDDVEHAAVSLAPPSDAGASPRARRRAEELGVDLADIRGSGPGGAVRDRDLPVVDRPVPSVPRAPTGGPLDRSASMRSAIARQMSVANREIPHYHLTTTIDLHGTLSWLAARNAGRAASERVLPAALFVAATARAMVEEPALNGSWIDDGFVAADGVHAAMAVSLRGGGLIAPVIHDADRLGIDAVMAALRDVVSRARHGGLRGSDLSGAGFTITDLGEHGADSVFGVIHPPQVALLGFGGIVDRPWAVDGLVGVRPTVTVTLSADHRATDGHVGSRYLAALRRILDHPELLEDR